MKILFFFKNIHQITFRLPDGKVGGIKLEDKDDVLKKIIWVNALTNEKVRSFGTNLVNLALLKATMKTKITMLISHIN